MTINLSHILKFKESVDKDNINKYEKNNPSLNSYKVNSNIIDLNNNSNK